MNNLGDLNAFLFEQMERLNDNELDKEGLKQEVERGKAMEGIAKTIISNGALVLQAKKMYDNRMDADVELPKMLEGDM